MQLICNELSFYPLADTSLLAEARLTKFLQTFKKAKQKYGFMHIRVPENHASQKITATQTFYEWLSGTTNHTLKALVSDLFKRPYTDDLNQAELDTYFESNYAIASTDCPTTESPVGLPVSYIQSMPAISFDSHAFWQTRKILINKTHDTPAENSSFYAYNLCLCEDIDSAEFNEWCENCLSNSIDTGEQLIKYLNYTKFTIQIKEDFMSQLIEWKSSDLASFKYILSLMKDVEIHPFTGGMGQTENLKYKGKEASKRINITDRLSYSIERNIVSFIACKGHYEFH